MRYFVFLSGMVLALASSASGETYVVNPEGTGDFPTIQAAIDSVLDGDIIELTDGTFTGDGNRDIDYLGKAITVRSQSGSPETCIIDCEGSQAEDHRGLVLRSGEGPDAVFEGITISNAYASFGGGIHLQDAHPTITDCIITHCVARDGGGIYMDVAEPIITECTFSDNAASHTGGGIHLSDSSPTFSECTICRNHATHGGGIAVGYLQSYYPEITDCLFLENSASTGGGAFCSGIEGVRFSRCNFVRNTATHHGAGMACDYDTNCFVRRCAFLENREADYGGGIYSEGTILLVDECTFWRNQANFGGGGLWRRFGLAMPSHCTFTENQAPQGSGVWCQCDEGLSMRHSIIAFGLLGSAVHCALECDVMLWCCDVYGNQGGDYVGCISSEQGIRGNISEDPLFCDLENGDLTLQECSPCAPFSPPNPECDLIGAWPVGCGGTPVIETTWGGIKALFRQ